MRRPLLLALPLILPFMANDAQAAATVTTAYQFSETTPLATGNWVRISTGESGVYEITYSELRAMGFSDPSKVAVYGLGATQRDINFLDIKGERMFEDNLQPVKILHSNDKILFYAVGPEKISFSMTGSGTGRRGIHTRESRNIYTDSSCYFLTDSHPVETVPETCVSDRTQAISVTTGYGVVYHEEDLKQGKEGCGQLFWGEQVSVGTPVKFSIEVPYAISDSPSALNCDIVVMEGQAGNFNIKVNTSERTYSLARSEAQVFSWTNVLTTNKLTVNSQHVGKGTLTFSATGTYNPDVPLAIDYWALTYPQSLEYAVSDPDFTQQYIAFAERSTMWKHPAPAGSMAWDISDRTSPVMLEVADGYFYKDNAGVSARTEAVVFDPAKTQKKINPGYVAVPNQDLHALQNDPVDMIIFATPSMLPYGRRIADLHENLDGQHVLVLDPQTVYNEFTSGNPDPMALRMFAKMLYHKNPQRLKNILLLGPVYADFRNKTGIEGRPEGMIAYQMVPAKLSTTPAPVMDYYGIMTDRISSIISLTSAPVSLGVGLLPIYSPEEGELAVAKIKDYLENPDFSNLVNESLSISCAGDGHIHDNQAIRWGTLLQSYENSYFDSEFAHRTIWLEATGTDKGHEQIFSSLNEGKLLSVYYGHAGEGGFAGFSVEDAMNISNKEPGFLFLAACDLCKPDVGTHGVGDMGVIRNRQGFAGVICATRTVLSNYNDTLARNFASSLFMKDAGAGTLRTTSPTVGEAFARAKDITSSNESKLAYVLIGDPALTVPVPLGRIELTAPEGTYRSGDLVEVKGRITDSNGSTITDYNGSATVKLMEPVRSIAAQTSTNNDGEIIIERDRIDYNDMRLLTVKADVKDGEFSVKLPLPAKCDNFLPSEGETASLPVFAGAYDPSTRLGTSGRTSLALATFGSTEPSVAEKDEEAPVLSLDYDPALCVVKVSASDNAAMLPGIGAGSGINLTIDGISYNVDGGQSDGVNVTNYSGSVSAARLGTGKHTAVAYATDLSGNRSDVKTYSFVIADKSALALSADRKIAIDSIAFSISGSDDDTAELNLIIADNKGNVVADEDFSGNSYECDTTDIPAGMYRAAVRHKSAAGTQIRSNWVEFTKID